MKDPGSKPESIRKELKSLKLNTNSSLFIPNETAPGTVAPNT